MIKPGHALVVWFVQSWCAVAASGANSNLDVVVVTTGRQPAQRAGSTPMRMANGHVSLDVDTVGSVLLRFHALSPATTEGHRGDQLDTRSAAVEVLRSFHGARAGSGPGGVLYNSESGVFIRRELLSAW